MTLSARVTSHDIVARSDKDLSEQFRTIAEIGGDVAWIIDCASCLPTYISPAIESLLGYQLADFQHQFSGKDSDGPLRALCAGLPARLYRFAAGDLTRLRVVRQFDQQHRDGQVVPIEVISTLMLDQDNAATSVVGILRDLSARREHEAEQCRFASMLNHEFRTPLSTIDGAIQRLQATGADADEATRKRYRKIGAAVERLIGMLDEYLSPDRMQAIGAERRPGTVDPRLLLEEGAELARAAGMPVTLALDDLPQALRCDPQGLRLALKVLIDNAIQYAAADTVIALSGRRTGGGVELSVRDHGAGVPAPELELVFTKSYRGSNAGTRPGSGLGLYMARSIIEVHGGSIDAHNAAPCGALFRIWLPVADGAGKSVASGAPSSDNSSNNLG